jgi:transglutaminase-like putative cysteine protease
MAVMTIKVALEHRTSYTFDRPVRVYPHVVRLRPAPHSRTSIEAYSLRVEPADHFVNWQQDAVGNFVYRLTFPNPTSRLTITVGLIADLKVINPFDFFIEDWAETWPAGGFTYPDPLADELRPYLRPVDEDGAGSGPGELVQAWVRTFAMPPGTRTINYLVELNRRINADLGYSVRMEQGVQTPDFTLRTGVGSCRDFAWLLVSVARQMGLAARFVSGYLVQLTSDVKALDGPSGPIADFTDLHAWAEVYVPGAGWIGLDPTSGLFAGEGHIPLAATPWSSPTPSPASTKIRGSHSPIPTRRGQRSRTSPAVSTSGWPPATSGSPSVASRPSCRSTTRSTTSGALTPTARTSANSPPSWPRD